jgi:hypothetical protein
MVRIMCLQDFIRATVALKHGAVCRPVHVRDVARVPTTPSDLNDNAHYFLFDRLAQIRDLKLQKCEAGDADTSGYLQRWRP